MRLLIAQCDWCDTRVEEADAANVEFELGNEIREMDLCPDCQRKLAGWSRVRRKIPGRRRANGTLERPAIACPECGQPCASPQGLSAHFRSAHPPSPNGTRRGGGPSKLRCPHCDDPRSFRAPGLALHIKANHPDALEEAEYEEA